MAVRLCGGRFTEEEFAEIERVLELMQTLQDGEITRLIACDHMLHQITVEKAGMPRLLKAWEELNYGNMAVSTASSSIKDNLAGRQYTIHRKLADAFRSGDEDTICRAIYDHYMKPVQALIRESELPDEDFKFF